MSLDIVFRTGRPRGAEEPLVERADQTLFRLHPGADGQYLLPQVALQTRAGMHVVKVHCVQPDVQGVGELPQVLRASWVRPDRIPAEVTGEVVLSEGVTVQPGIVQRSIDLRHPGRSVLVRVLWKLAYDDPSGGNAPEPVLVELEFLPPGGKRPSTADADTAGATLAVEPVSHRGSGDKIPGWAAIDLGTSSSTITMCRARAGGMPGMDPAQEGALGSQLATLLDSLSDHAATEWEKVSGTIPANATTTLTDRLRDQPDPQLVQSVVAAIELLCRDDPEIADTLRSQLHACYRAALRTPPLETYKLEPHRFPTPGTPSVDSVVSVVSTTELPMLYLGERPKEFPTGDETEKATKIRDLKRRFASGRSRSLPELKDGDGRATSIHRVVAAAYDFLAGSAEQQIKNERVTDEGEDYKPEFAHIVATYPTTTTPAARKALRTLLSQVTGFDKVITHYDEGVAAGLYFLMQDIGKDQATGAEMFRSRARAVPNSERVWEQTAVVVDIGGGTTDIAVIRYTMTDETPPGPEVLGRGYRIQPEVVGSTGHPLLGGHYLTLRVFYWLKAAIIDAILTQNDAELQSFRDEVTVSPPGGLAAAMLAGGTDGKNPAPSELRDLLRDLLPTTWPKEGGTAADQTAFDAFWRKADEAKIALGKPGAEPFTITAADLRKLFETFQLARRQQGPISKLWDAGTMKWRIDDSVKVELRPANFATLIQPVIDIAAQHAASIVQTVLTNGRASGLDRILLSGQSSLMPLVAERVKVAMATVRMPEPRSRGRRMPEPEVERTYAKQAASIGACWAESNVQFGQKKLDDEAVGNGRTELMIRVDNMHTALPTDFLVRKFGRVETLFKLGEPFRELDGDTGRRGVRTPGFSSLTATHHIFRVLGHQSLVPWSSFTDSDLAEGGADGKKREPSPHIFGDGGTMKVMVELDQACAPTLHLCNHGEPHYVATGVPVTVIGWPERQNQLNSLPKITVRTGKDTPDDPRRTLTLCEACDEPAAITKFFNIQVHPDQGLDSPAIGGHVFRSLPKVSPQTGTYTFVVDGATFVSDPVKVPGARDTTEYHALLLETGEIRVFRGELPFLRAENLHELETRPGAVLSREVYGGEPDENIDWDPFTGKH